MGGIVQSITDALDPLDNWLEGAGDTISKGFREIGNFAESIGKEIGKVGQAAINDPFGTIAKVAAVATGNAWALPLISAASVVANGGDLGQAALSAGISWAGMQIAGFVSDSLQTFHTTGGESLLTGVESLPNGSSLYTYSDGSSMLVNAAGKATFNTSLIDTGSAAWNTAINKAIGNAVGSGAIGVAQGDDFGSALATGLYGGIGNLAGYGAITGLQDLGVNAPLSNILGRTAGAATRGLLAGQDFAETFGNAFVGNVVNTSLSNYGEIIKNSDWAKGVQNQFNQLISAEQNELMQYGRSFSDTLATLSELEYEIEEVVNNGNELFAESRTYYDEMLLPSQEAAEAARNTALESQAAHRTLADQFSELVRKYDEAKAAGDVDLANSYADQANAMIPDVDAAAAKYNSDYAAYESAAAEFNTRTQTYEQQVNQLTQLNERYIELSNQAEQQGTSVKEQADLYNQRVDTFQDKLDQVLKDTAEAAEKIEDFSDEAKGAFEDAFAKGYDPLKAADFSEDINEQGGIGQEAYKEAIESGMDFDKAYQFSQDVNSLRTDRQGYYEFASEFGLSQKDAYELVDNIEKLSPAAQSAFFDGLREDNNLIRAMEAANQVNELSEEKQNSYLYARGSGLSFDQAFTVADTVSDLSPQQQLTYMNAIANGGDNETAMLLAMAQGLVSGGEPIANVFQQERDFKTLEGEAIYNNAIAYGYDPERAYREAMAWESQVTGPQFQTQEATDQYREFIRNGYPAELAQAWAEGTDQAHAAAGTGTQVASLEPTGYVTIKQIPDTGEGMGGTGGTPGVPPLKLVSEVEDPITGNITQTYEDGSSKTFTSEGYQIVQGPSIQEWIDELFKTTPPERKLKTTTAGGGTGGGTDTGTGGTGGTGTGAGTGTGTEGTGTGGTGTGTGGTTGGTGTGAGGTDTTGGGTGGTGTGGTGTGTGGAGGGGGFGLGGMTPFERYTVSQQFMGAGAGGAGAGITNLTPGLTKAGTYELTGLPTFDQDTNAMENVEFAKGGLVALKKKRQG